MKKVVLLLVMELMLLYPAEDTGLEMAIETPLFIKEETVTSYQEKNTIHNLNMVDNITLDKEAEKTSLPQTQELPPVVKEVQERKEAENISRHEERKNVQIFEATAYCSCVKCCGKSDGITKSGVKVHKGTLAVDPKVIPLGTKVYIEGMGWFIAEDTGNFSGKRVDIYMETHEKALQFGRQKVKIVF